MKHSRVYSNSYKFIFNYKIIEYGSCDCDIDNNTQLNNNICTEISPSGGVIQSPNYPSDYGSNREIVYTIEVPSNERISLTFMTFVLEENLDFISVCLNTPIF